MESSAPRLVGDVGGTRARFALFQPDGSPDGGAGGGLQHIHVVATHECESLVEAVGDYLSQLPDGLAERPRLAEAVFAVAGPVHGDRVQLTNCPWAVSIEETRRELGIERLALVNDVEALAAALPYLNEQDLTKVGGGEAVPDAPRAVIAPGTGLGMAALVPCAGGWLSLASEGGHATFTPNSVFELSLSRELGSELDHVSSERLVSGPGLLHIYRQLAAANGVEPQAERPEDVTERTVTGADALCSEAADRFAQMLGSVAGDLALTLGARGGIYVGGGIARDLGSHFNAPLFRERFEAKGRMRSYLENVPSYLVRHRYPALLGAAHHDLES